MAKKTSRKKSAKKKSSKVLKQLGLLTVVGVSFLGGALYVLTTPDAKVEEDKEVLQNEINTQSSS